MERIRVAQIGIGHDHASGVFETLQLMQDEVEIVGYCIPDDDRTFVETRIKYYAGFPQLSLEEILNDPTIRAVTVETEDHLLTKYTQFALDAGKHVHMDKPGGTDQCAFERMTKTAEEKGLALSLGYMYRFNPALLELFEKVRAGELGEILYVNAEMNCWHKPVKREWLGQYPGGMMHFLGCHLVDLIYRLQGEPLEVIPLHASSGMDGIASEDNALTAFRYPHGVSFARTTASERGGYHRRNLVVVGTKGTFELKPSEYRDREIESWDSSGDFMKSDYHYTYETPWHLWVDTETTQPFHRYRNMLEAFLQYVRGEKENPYTPEFEARLHRLLLKACGVELP